MANKAFHICSSSLNSKNVTKTKRMHKVRKLESNRPTRL